MWIGSAKSWCAAASSIPRNKISCHRCFDTDALGNRAAAATTALADEGCPDTIGSHISVKQSVANFRF